MSVKQVSNRKTSITTPQKSSSKKTNDFPFLPIIIIFLYLLVDFIPEWGGVDVIGSQWVYLAAVTLVSTTYIFYFTKSEEYQYILKRVSSKFLSLAYFSLFVLAGISIFFAINKIEALVSYAYFIITILAFFNIAILLSRDIKSFKIIAQAVSIILLIQSIHTLFNFFDGISKTPLNDLIINLKGNTGNKNIFAASLVVKISCVMYCTYIFRSWLRFVYTVTLTLGTISIFLINARSAYLGLSLQVSIFLIFIVLQYLKDKKAKEGLLHLCTILVPIFLAFFIAQISLNNTKQENGTQSDFSSITERFGSIVSKTNGSNEVRLKLWSSGIDYIKQHPLMGSGYGNCKLAIIPYEHSFMTGFLFNQHLHNDFIEIAFELGILGGLLFIALFISALIGAIKVWKSKADDPVKVIAVFSLIALAGYFTDAFFNFPCERPIMQLLFALVLGVNISTWVNTPEEKRNNTKFKNSYTYPLIGYTSLILLIFAGYFRYLTYQSLVAQTLTIPDFPNQATHSSQEINDKLPDIPNIDANNIPVDVVKAWYLFKEGKNEEAMILLNKSTQVNPYNLANEFIKAQIFLQTHQLDSAFYYANKGFQTRPSHIGFYVILNDLYRQKQDTLNVKKTFQKCIQHLNTASVWGNYISTLMALNYPNDRLLSTISAALKLFPNERSIQEKEILIKSTLAMNTSNYQVALSGFTKLTELNPTHYNYWENIGVCHFALKNYEQAILYFDKVITARAYSNGKAEYFKGLCLFNLGKKLEGCSYLKIASSKNYPGAASLVSSYCK